MAFTLPIRDSVLTRNVKCSGKLREELNRADIHALRSTMRSLKIRKKNVYGLCALRLWNFHMVTRRMRQQKTTLTELPHAALGRDCRKYIP